MTIATDSLIQMGYEAPVATKTLATEAPKSGIKPKPSGPNRAFAKENVTYGDWRDDLVRDGYVVVKGAVPRERAEKYGDEMLSWLENLYVCPYHSIPEWL